MHLNIYYKDST